MTDKRYTVEVIDETGDWSTYDRFAFRNDALCAGRDLCESFDSVRVVDQAEAEILLDRIKGGAIWEAGKTS